MIEFVVALAAGAIGLVVGWLWGRRSARDSALAATDLAIATTAPEALYQIDELNAVVEFDRNGDGVYARTEQGIQPKFDVAELTIPYRFGVSQQGSLENPEFLATSMAVSFEPITIERTHMIGSVKLTGPFTRGKSIGGYTLKQRFTKAFLMTRAEVVEAYKDSPMQCEYFGIATYVPARQLRCVVKFPDVDPDLSRDAFPCAFWGDTESLHETETGRLSSAFRLHERVAELTIERPRSGIRYAIAWLGSERRSARW